MMAENIRMIQSLDDDLRVITLQVVILNSTSEQKDPFYGPFTKIVRETFI